MCVPVCKWDSWSSQLPEPTPAGPGQLLERPESKGLAGRLVGMCVCTGGNWGQRGCRTSYWMLCVSKPSYWRDPEYVCLCAGVCMGWEVLYQQLERGCRPRELTRSGGSAWAGVRIQWPLLDRLPEPGCWRDLRWTYTSRFSTNRPPS